MTHTTLKKYGAAVVLFTTFFTYISGMIKINEKTSTEDIMHYGNKAAVKRWLTANQGDLNTSYTLGIGFLPLHYAVSFENEEAVKLLLEHGANPLEKVRSQRGGARGKFAQYKDLNAIELAEISGNQRIASLLRNGEESDHADSDDSDGILDLTLLGKGGGHKPPNREPLRRSNSDGNFEDQQTRLDDELYMAVIHQHTSKIKELLRRGANPNCYNAHTNFLMEAVSYQNVEMAEVLLSGGANPNYIDSLGKSPLMEVCGAYNPNLDMVKLLIRYKANVNYSDDNGTTVLKQASNDQEKNRHIIQALRAAGANDGDERRQYSPPIRSKPRSSSASGSSTQPKTNWGDVIQQGIKIIGALEHDAIDGYNAFK